MDESQREFEDQENGTVPCDPRAQETATSTIERAWIALASVKDPEIPVLSVLDMGMIADVRLHEARLEIDVTPTFAACPALAVIRDEIRSVVAAACAVEVTVNFVFDPPWTPDRITEEGRIKLREFGIAPPPPPPPSPLQTQSASAPQPSAPQRFVEIRAETPGSNVPCPFCGSSDTALESPFGPTLCRSVHYCHACRQSFEHVKPL
jgi:ring-1,2-phenylacetyl-CoA epoxidase subunit PaaD